MKSFAMGIVCAPIGILIGLYIAFTAIGRGYEFFPIYAGLAAFLASFFFWWLIVVRRDVFTTKSCVFAGGISGIIAHYLCWYLMIFAHNICFRVSGGCLSSLGDPPMDPVNALWGSLGFTFFSLLFFGWITVPLGALAGFFVGRYQQKHRAS